MAIIGSPLYSLSISASREDEKLTRTINGVNLPPDYQEGDETANLVRQFGQLLFAASVVDFGGMQVMERRTVEQNG